MCARICVKRLSLEICFGAAVRNFLVFFSLRFLSNGPHVIILLFFIFRTVNIQTISFRSFSAVVIALVSYSGHAANAWHCLSTNLFSCIIFNPIEVFLIAVIIGCRSVGTSLSRAVSLTHCSCVCASARQKWVTLSWTAWRAVNIIRHLLI